MLTIVVCRDGKIIKALTILGYCRNLIKFYSICNALQTVRVRLETSGLLR
jgi:hypothetical protein